MPHQSVGGFAQRAVKARSIEGSSADFQHVQWLFDEEHSCNRSAFVPTCGQCLRLKSNRKLLFYPPPV
jgi:hypothetical protein